MRRYIFPFLALFLLGFTGDSPSNYPQDYFRSPVDFPIRLSGTFGELRPNHFHAGIDIKPKNGIGDRIFSIAEGTVSRINISPRGYGNCLYIDHPNGYTSVYAHLSAFSPAIEQYIKEQQALQQQFALELYPEYNRFVFKKGQEIGKMGTSGRSFGPHLHFEIRNTGSEWPINPLLFGFQVKDHTKPLIQAIKVYELDPNLREIGGSKHSVLKGSNRNYIKGDTLTVGAWRIGLGIKAFDQMDGVSNLNGIYSTEMFVDGQQVYGFTMESFSFDETRYINAHQDYKERTTRRKDYNRCFRLPGNQLSSIYQQIINDGVIDLESSHAKKVEFVVKDKHGNSSKLYFYVRRGEVKPPADDLIYNYIIPYNAESNIVSGQSEIRFPTGAFYEDTYLLFNSSRELTTNVYSDTYHIGERTTPVHKHFELAIRPMGLPENLRSKAVIASCVNNRLSSSRGGEWQGDFLVAKVRNLGDFCITVDTKAPIVTPLNFKSWMGRNYALSFKITDDFAGIETYRAELDGQWVLLTYDEKKAKVTMKLPSDMAKGKHEVRVLVTDGVGNEKVFSRGFSY